jgi:hypothetical protein
MSITQLLCYSKHIWHFIPYLPLSTISPGRMIFLPFSPHGRREIHPAGDKANPNDAYNRNVVKYKITGFKNVARL